MGNAHLSDSGLYTALSVDRSCQWRWWPLDTILRQWRDDEAIQPAQVLDVYAFGKTIMEVRRFPLNSALFRADQTPTAQIYTEDVPFPQLPDGPKVVARIFRDGFPRVTQPATMDDEVWRIVKACCDNDELRRPPMTVATEWIRNYAAR